ncbi:MAG: hypothetical protein Q8L86_07740 [Vicinamibacterales bacterium]|nr:hypothetical protein [Vicinamibacterales bacterium]
MGRAGLVLVMLALAAPIGAQPAPAGAAAPVDRMALRHQIYVMEGALARAVAFGAQRLNHELRTVAPGMLMLAGDANARGFHLEGYGVFFDVEVPVLRESMMWSLRTMLEQDDEALREALGQLKQFVQAQQPRDPRQRAALDSALRRLELQVQPAMPLPARGAASGPGTVSAAGVLTEGASVPPPVEAAPAAPPVDRVWIEDPGRAYTESVQRALVDAMIDYSAPMAVSPDEWLTVAARDNERRDRLAPQDPYEEVLTIILRVRGSDLAAYRAGKIDRDEVRRRVSAQTF